jgi:hypothetical protein
MFFNPCGNHLDSLKSHRLDNGLNSLHYFARMRPAATL